MGTTARLLGTGEAFGLLVEGDGGGHMGEVADALGEVAEQLAVLDVVLLGEQAQVVARGDGPVEDPARFVQPALAGETFREPERAGHEDALVALESVVAAVPAQEAVAVRVELGPGGI